MFRLLKTCTPALLMSLIFIPLVSNPEAALPAPPTQVYTVSPNPAPKDKAFELSLLGGNWDCSSTFSRESVTVSTKRIDLSFVVRNRLYIDPPALLKEGSIAPMPPICAYATSPATLDGIAIGDGPSFSIPALKEGKYEVWATQMAECLYTQPMCKIAVIPQYAGVLEVSTAGAISYSINPTATVAGKDFSLDLLSYQFKCTTTFDNLSSYVTGSTISVNFLDHETVGGICPAIYKPYGPTFKMKGLKAGTYKVIAYRLPACYPQGCLIAPQGVDAGNLVVTDTTTIKDGWYLKEKKVALGRDPYPMQILNNKYGNCNTSFSNLGANISSSGIYLDFLIESHPGRLCIMDQRPYGPTFQLIPPIKPGAYPIYVTELLPCEVSIPQCAVDRVMPKASDTLYITSPTAILKQGINFTQPSAAFHGNILELTLPGKVGGGLKTNWKIDILDLSGRVLDSRQVQVEGLHGGVVRFEAKTPDQRGMYLLRMTSETGKIHSLPIVDKD